jgi:hypothetical protein
MLYVGGMGLAGHLVGIVGFSDWELWRLQRSHLKDRAYTGVV